MVAEESQSSTLSRLRKMSLELLKCFFPFLLLKGAKKSFRLAECFGGSEVVEVAPLKQEQTLSGRQLNHPVLCICQRLVYGLLLV